MTFLVKMQLYDKFPKISKIPSPPIHPLDDFEVKVPPENCERDLCGYHYMHLYLNCSYFLFIIPFRPVRNSHSGHFKLHTSKFQKTVCLAGIWTTAFFYRFTQLRRAWQSLDTHSTIFYFKISNNHIFTCRLFLFFWVLIKKHDMFEDLVEKIGHCTLLFPRGNGNSAQRWPLVIAIHATYVFLVLSALILGSDSPPIINSWDWNMSWLWRSYVARARFTFFINTNASLIHVRPELSDISTLDMVFGCLEMWMKFVQEATLACMNLFIFNIFPLTIWSAADNFEKYLCSLKVDGSTTEKQQRLEVQKSIWNKYHELKYLSRAFNTIWSIVTFLAILDIIPWLAVDLDYGLRANDWCDKITKLFSLVNISVALILAAETCRKIHWFKAWLTDWNNFRMFWEEREKLEVLIRELQSVPAPVGVGSPGFYQIDYAFLGQLVVIVITFFIISLQYTYPS